MEPIFPNEILELIVSNLKKEHNTLLNCRLVSKSFKTFAEKVLNSTFLWRPVEEDFPSFLKRVNGTRFSSAKEVKLFLKETKNFSNPFPNGTVIFCLDKEPETFRCEERPCHHTLKDIQEIYDFYNSFCRLASAHKDNITTLVFSFNVLSHIYLSGKLVDSILKLKYLKQLAIHKGKSPCPGSQKGDRSFRDWRVKFTKRKLEFVTEFLVFDDKLDKHTRNSYLSPLRNLFTAVKDSVKRLRFYHGDSVGILLSDLFNDMDWKCPKLEELAVYELGSQIDLDFFECEIPLLRVENSPKFRELIVKFESEEGNVGYAVKHLFSLLNEHSESLERLCLFINENKLPSKLPKIKRLTFPKIKYLTLNYNCLKWNKLMGIFKEKFVNLGELKVLVRSEDEVDEKKILKSMMGLWKLFDKMEVIDVPYFKWKVGRNGII